MKKYVKKIISFFKEQNASHKEVMGFGILSWKALRPIVLMISITSALSLIGLLSTNYLNGKAEKNIHRFLNALKNTNTQTNLVIEEDADDDFIIKVRITTLDNKKRVFCIEYGTLSSIYIKECEM